MNRWLIQYVRTYAFFLVVYVYFMQGILKIPAIQVLGISVMVMTVMNIILRHSWSLKRSIFCQMILVMVASIASYHGQWSCLWLILYYASLVFMLYYTLLKSINIEYRDVYLPLLLGLCVALYQQDFPQAHIEYMFCYGGIGLLAICSDNLETFYQGRVESKEKFKIQGILITSSLFISLCVHWIYQWVSLTCKVLFTIVAYLFQQILGFCILTMGRIVGYFLAWLVDGELEIDIKMPSVALDKITEMAPTQARIPQILEWGFQMFLIVVIILIVRWVYHHLKKKRKSLIIKKERPSYYQEIETIEHEKLFRDKKEHLSKIRKAYRREVRKKIKKGYMFKIYDTPRTYLNTLPQEEKEKLQDLSKLYEKERYCPKEN